MSTNDSVVIEFEYRPNPWLVSGLFLTACAGAALLAYMSFDVEGGANIRGIIVTELQLRWLFRVLFVLSPIGLVAIGSVVYVAWFGKQRVALTHHSLLAPKPTRFGLSSQEIEIVFAEIRDVGVHDFIGSTRVLRIERAGGAVSIVSNMFRSKGTFDEVVQCVQSALDEYRRLTANDSPGFTANPISLEE